jgi:maltose-binding protein MalE
MIFITLMLVGMLVLAACGGEEEPTPEPTEAPAEPTEAAADEPEEEPMEEAAEETTEEEMMDEKTIVDVAVENGSFTTLVAAVQAAGLAETLSGEGPFTVFAPTDDAFAALPEGTVESLLEDPEGALTDILLYHVAEGAVPAETVVTLDSVTTVQGEDVAIEVVDGQVVLNESATVVITDVEASNGIIHVIDAVILPPSIAAADEEAAAEPELSLTIWADETQGPILAELAGDFEAEYGVGLVVESFTFGDINDQLPIAAPAGEGPDLFVGPHDRAGSHHASGLLAPIDLGDKADSFTGVTLDAFTIDGELYGMPYGIENLALFRNTDLAPEAPTTWEELIEMSQPLIDSGDAAYGLAFPGTSYDIYPLHTSFGGYIFGQDENGNWNPSDLGINSEGMVAAGEWLAEQVEAGVVSDNTDRDVVRALFESGELPFIMDGPWSINRYVDAGIPFAISDIPSDGQPFGGVQGFMINALSENVLLAQAFLTEFIATEEIMTQLYQAGNRPSAFAPVLEATDDANLLAFGSAGANASLMPNIPEMGGVWGPWGDAFALILSGELEPAEALATAEEQINAVIGGAFAGMVNVPGSWQMAAGCEADWLPECEATALTEGDDGLFTGSFEIPAGDYEAKVAHDGGWGENYGVEGEFDGPNYAFSLAADGTVTFSYDPETHILTITVE